MFCKGHHRADLSAAPAARKVAGCIASASTSVARSPTSPSTTRATGTLRHFKVASTPADPSEAIETGLRYADRRPEHRSRRDRLRRPWHHGRHQHGDRAPRRAHRTDHHAAAFATSWRSGGRFGHISTTIPCARRRHWCRANAAWKCPSGSMPLATCWSPWMKLRSRQPPMRLQRRACRQSPSASCTAI